ncbi:MAG: hypothetical protein R6U95_08140 [Bacteroidales bacterium]
MITLKKHSNKMIVPEHPQETTREQLIRLTEFVSVCVRFVKRGH